MAFLIAPDTSVARGLKRLARKQLRAAARALDDRTPRTDSAVHTARTRVKKARAIVRMLRADGAAGLGNTRKQLQRISDALSPIRDAAVMRDSLERLREKEEGLFTEQAYRALTRRLSGHVQALRRAAHRDGTWKKARRRLRTLARDTAQWRPRHRRLRLLTAGLAGAHRRMEKALARSERRGRPIDFHRLRKAVKSLWYQLRLLDRPGSPVHADVTALNDAEAALGDDHNITVLLAQIGEDSGSEPIAFDLEGVAAAALRHQESLRRRAVARVRPIVGVHTRDYVRAVRAAWTGDK